MQKLQLAGPDKFDPDGVPVVALAHNEANILPDFLDHYRKLCKASFLIVDDRSSDDTARLLAEAPDVTVFHPANGSTYSKDKAQWRSDLLDQFADGRWCLVPDLDEHFVFFGQPTMSLQEYVTQLEGEGAQAVPTLMIDMYADAPLAEHIHPEDAEIPLNIRFPLFDGPQNFPGGYTMRPISRAMQRKYPAPPITFTGGARDRLFYPALDRLGPIANWTVRNWMHMDGPINRQLAPWQRSVVGRVGRRYLSGRLNCTKLGLIRWQAGLRFNGGAHKVDQPIQVSESIAAFLHYAFTRGRAGVEYIAKRGQHADGGKYYYHLLQGDGLNQSPSFEGSRTYKSPADLAGLIRGVPGQ